MGKDQSAPAHHSDWKNWTLDPWHRAGLVVPGRTVGLDFLLGSL